VVVDRRCTSFGPARQFFGQVVARQTVDLAFQVAGQIVELPLVEGASIKEGDIIGELDLETFLLARDQAKLQKEQAERTLDRLTKLGATVSQVNVDDAKTALALAEIAERNAEFALEHATLISPFDAIVASRNVANFTTIAAGTPVARLHDMSEIRIDIDVPEVLFQQAGANPNVRLTATFPTSDTSYPLVIREFNAETASVAQTYGLTLALTAPDGIHILPGSSVTVTAQFVDIDGAIDVPASAIVIGAGDTTSVFVFSPSTDDHGTVAQRTVSVTPNGNGGFDVTDGLLSGDIIVSAGAKTLTDGATVRRFTGFAN
jgi:RND family efflux transporter MFP subunit